MVHLYQVYSLHPISLEEELIWEGDDLKELCSGRLSQLGFSFRVCVFGKS